MFRMRRRTNNGISNQSIRRLARKGGVKRMASTVYPAIRHELRSVLRRIIEDAITYTAYGKRSTVTSMDVVYALKRNGITIYGFGG